MNYLIFISVAIISIYLSNSVYSQTPVTECWKDNYLRPVNSIHDAENRNCTLEVEGNVWNGYWAAGLCYGPCKPDEERQLTGWCKKPNGIVYISSTYQPKCNSKYEEQAGLCYKFCKQGYKGVGILCWTDCSERTDYFNDCGLFCGPNGLYCEDRNLFLIFNSENNKTICKT